MDAEQDVGGTNNKRSDELRIRATHLGWRPLKGCAPLAASSLRIWVTFGWQRQPSGKLTPSLDVRCRQQRKPLPEATWKRSGTGNSGKLLPGAENFSGKLEGSVENGRLTVEMHDAKNAYETVFRAPLEIEKGNAVLNWLRNDKGFQLVARHIDVKAKAVHARGIFAI